MLKNVLPLGELSVPCDFNVNLFTTQETLALPGLQRALIIMTIKNKKQNTRDQPSWC